MINEEELTKGTRLFSPKGESYTVEVVTEESVYFFEPRQGSASSYANKKDVCAHWMKAVKLFTSEATK